MAVAGPVSAVDGVGAGPTPDVSPVSAKIPSSTSQPVAAHDRYYGHRAFAQIAERFIMALFGCPHDSMASTPDSPTSSTEARAPRLAYFVAYALYRTRLPMLISYHALLLLKRLKTRYPVARGSSGHRLYISAFMLASKMVCDDSYNNKSWTVVCQNLFTLREVNQMERELLGYLDLHINATAEEISEFTSELELYGAPRMSLRALQELQLPAARTHASYAPEPKPQSSKAATSTPSVARASRASSHRRCVSLKPDFWARSAGASTIAAAHCGYACANEQGIGPHRPTLRTSTRSSLPARSSQHALGSAAQVAATSTVPPYPPYVGGDHTISPTEEFYMTSNASSASIQTPSSFASSMRPTPSTSLSELGTSPWYDMNALAAGLPQSHAPHAKEALMPDAHVDEQTPVHSAGLQNSPEDILMHPASFTQSRSIPVHAAHDRS